MRFPPLSGNAVKHAESKPERESAAWNRLTTSVLYQPAPFAAVVGPRSVIAGAVLSILNAALVAAPAAALLPARSVKAGLPTVIAAPSPLVVLVSVLERLPDGTKPDRL